MLPLERREPLDEIAMRRLRLLVHPSSPGGRGVRCPTPGEDAVGHVHRPERPGDPIVLGLQPQEVEQDVETLPPIRLRGGRVPVAVLRVVFGDALEDESQPCRRLLEADLPRGDGLDQPLRLDRFVRSIGLLDRRLDPSPHAPPQDPSQGSRGEDVLREEAVAIPFDEVPYRLERAVVADPLEHAQPQLPGVGHPGLEQPRHEEREPLEHPRRHRGRVGGIGGALDDPLDQGRRRRLEDAVELAHARGALGPISLERLGEVHDGDRLVHQPQPRQAGGDPFEQPLPAAGMDDPVGPPAPRQRDVEHLPPDQAALHDLERGLRPFDVAGEHRGDELAGRAPLGRTLGGGGRPRP